MGRRLAQERRKKRTIVFTNGCFDLIHAGHLKIFLECKKKGDVLVLGLNSDSSVRRIKGPKRPIITEQDRALLLAGFEPIDYVVIFKEDTPERLIQWVKPDVLIKGGDWKASEIVGSDVAKKVVRIPLVKGRSTSEIIRLIAQRYGQ
ncbi:MAG: Bifunctional protein HldE [Elusimicrobia bacterium]|nr:Bifunctional protein HldE [Elusimicrobiota bacterium]